MVLGDDFYRMTPMEVAGGWLPGVAAQVEPPARSSAETPLAALEHVLLPALDRGPCVVTFSGGRDSSAVLAAAVHVARKEGLPLPIAATKIFPGRVETEESEWQEMVIRHLGITEWVRREYGDELDILGPTGTASLREHGLLWPATVHTNSPFLELAKGGTHLTGEGGDEILGAHRITPLTQLLTRTAPINRITLKHTAKSIAPRVLRRPFLARKGRSDAGRTWLQPEARREFDRMILDETVSEPLRWSASVGRIVRHRTPVLGLHNLRIVAAKKGVVTLHPLREPRFVSALFNHTGIHSSLGFPSRTHAMRAVFGELLPDEVLTRRSKAHFNRAYFGRYSREFVASWTGKGIDPDIVDEQMLRSIWASEQPHAGTYSLLHAAWLADNDLPENPETG